MTKTKGTTTDDLARMVQKGFDGVDKKLEKTATKEDLASTEAKLETRLDGIENLLLRALENRIERLEDDMRVVKTTLGR